MPYVIYESHDFASSSGHDLVRFRASSRWMISSRRLSVTRRRRTSTRVARSTCARTVVMMTTTARRTGVTAIGDETSTVNDLGVTWIVAYAAGRIKRGYFQAQDCAQSQGHRHGCHHLSRHVSSVAARREHAIEECVARRLSAARQALHGLWLVEDGDDQLARVRHQQDVSPRPSVPRECAEARRCTE